MGRKMDEYHDRMQFDLGVTKSWINRPRDRGTAEPPEPAEPDEPVFFYVK